MELPGEQIRVVTPAERTAGPSTPGMDRQQAFASETMWSGYVRTEAGMVSGWHHHGDHDTIVYVLSGRLAIEFGEGGRRAVQVTAGDFLVIPSGLVHREGTPTGDP